MSACKSGNNTKETNLQDHISKVKPQIKDETIINGKQIIEIDYIQQIYQKLYVSYKLKVHQIQDF